MVDAVNESDVAVTIPVTLIAKVECMAMSPDGSQVGLLGADAQGRPLMVMFPHDVAPVAYGELQRGIEASEQARAVAGVATAERAVSARLPATFHVAETNEHVMLAFDQGKPSMAAYAFPGNGAMMMANALVASAQRLAARRPRIILPN